MVDISDISEKPAHFYEMSVNLTSQETVSIATITGTPNLTTCVCVWNHRTSGCWLLCHIRAIWWLQLILTRASSWIFARNILWGLFLSGTVDAQRMVATACTLPQGEARFRINYHNATSSNIMSESSLWPMVHCQMIMSANMRFLN